MLLLFLKIKKNKNKVIKNIIICSYLLLCTNLYFLDINIIIIIITEKMLAQLYYMLCC